ncbi:DotU family type IV/VI secretion system protein [Marinomonas aquiplantarum]|uniref:Type IV/VI secretion system ImpK/VasF family protein n=1 Tax=Marinomonas aquiplantarum TaxID=491951 RepID=A0A366CVN9_9GAMM|nr:DotU family type IV/VI secretion system protein [Marinomonas aquiplantarum]RBO81901.1 type IV/VI secretion system ImpK/VasF family protein [Marinomonas aquiplantarum]
MNQPGLHLVRLMNEFYQQIITLKHWIVKDQLLLEAKSILKLQALPNPNETATAVNLFLSQWLAEKRQYWASQLTERQALYMDKACFSMVALADELLILELEWVGQESWESKLLEEHFFHSCSAGGTLYRHIDDLLAKAEHEPLEVQLAGVYLLTLRLGFSGQHRDDVKALKHYRHKLFQLVAKHQPVFENILFAQAYEAQMEFQQEQRLAPVSIWYRCAFYIAILYLISGTVAWFILLKGLDKWGAL